MPTRLPPSSISGATASASALNEYALVRKASSADSRRRGHEVAAERVAGSEGDRVQRAVEAAPALLQLADERLEVLRVVHVELEHVRRIGQPRRGALGHPARAPEAGEHHLGALLLGALGDGVGDAALGQHARDEQALALEHQLRQTSSTFARTASRPAWFTIRSRASTSPCSGVELLCAHNFTLDVHGVADLHRLLEHGVAHPAQGHDPIGVERQQAHGEGQHEQAVRDLLAEAAVRGPFGVGVLRVARRR